jgi:hypothetical protein
MQKHLKLKKSNISQAGATMENNPNKEKGEASKTNLQVCSILLTAVSLVLKFSDLSQMTNWTMIFGAASIWFSILFLAIAIFLEADAVFYYSRKEEELGDYFDRYGYKAMRGGLFFILSLINYIMFLAFYSSKVIAVMVADSLLLELVKAVIPFIFTLVLYISWRIFKCRKVGCKWYAW